MALKITLLVLGLLLGWLTWQRIQRKDFSSVTALIGAGLGFFIGDQMGISMMGTSINGAWPMAVLLFVLGGMVHFTDRRRP